MFAVVYISSESVRLSDEDLVNLLRDCRRKNVVSEITGLLLFKDGNFMQLMEGPEHAVRATLAKIQTDSGHRGIRVLMEEEIAQREFGDWSMGFRKLDHQTVGDVAGYSDFLELPFTSEAFLLDPSKALRFLLIFKKSVL